jgi:hypothetical protein
MSEFGIYQNFKSIAEHYEIAVGNKNIYEIFICIEILTENAAR